MSELRESLYDIFLLDWNQRYAVFIPYEALPLFAVANASPAGLDQRRAQHTVGIDVRRSADRVPRLHPRHAPTGRRRH